MKTKSTDDILSDYDKKANEILFKMYQLLAKAQRKVENKEYRRILQGIRS